MACKSLTELLERRELLTERLSGNPFSVVAFCLRAEVYASLAYPDLAVGDLYKAILLGDEILDASGEYHEQALAAFTSELRSHAFCEQLELQSGLITSSVSLQEHVRTLAARLQHADHDILADSEDLVALVSAIFSVAAPCRLASHLRAIGCLRSAYNFCQNALKVNAEYAPAIQEKQRILALAASRSKAKGELYDPENVNVNDLPDRGFVRRELYPWNHHEFERMSDRGLRVLNEQMNSVAPKLQVRATELPDLLSGDGTSAVSKQLGVFAREDIRPGEQVLCERSLLTATARDHEPLCDACGVALPELQASSEQDASAGPVPCPECDDVAFCSQSCLELAQASYHETLCGMDIESIGKDVPAAQAADALYVQLMFRAMAMSHTQDLHPLELMEVKFIWGDFSDTQSQSSPKCEDIEDDPFLGMPRTLPYDFQSQVLQPLHLLEQLDVSPFEAPHELAETWVYNTLLAKFRGTASARISPRDGRPELAAVHPLWCLANHSCDPNVEWEWSGIINFHARDKTIDWAKKDESGNIVGAVRPGRAAGIAAGEEILNHYVDIGLPVRARREWGVGALGGHCRCERCLWEAAP